jgi:hypothetical protein
VGRALPLAEWRTLLVGRNTWVCVGRAEEVVSNSVPTSSHLVHVFLMFLTALEGDQREVLS